MSGVCAMNDDPLRQRMLDLAERLEDMRTTSVVRASSYPADSSDRWHHLGQAHGYVASAWLVREALK